jgi:hypothetical protein
MCRRQATGHAAAEGLNRRPRPPAGAITTLLVKARRGRRSLRFSTAPAPWSASRATIVRSRASEHAERADHLGAAGGAAALDARHAPLGVGSARHAGGPTRRGAGGGGGGGFERGAPVRTARLRCGSPSAADCAVVSNQIRAVDSEIVVPRARRAGGARCWRRN